MVREFFIDRTYKEDLIVTLDQEEREVMWSRLRDMQEADVTLPGYVVSANLGGCVVEIEGFDVEGFVPNSHLGALQSEEREELISRELELKILDLDEEEEHVTLSARAVESAGVLENFRIGDVVAGTVSRVEPYGAFVDVGDGGNGLLHVSQISHDRVTNVEDLMTVGDQLKVRAAPRTSVSVLYRACPRPLAACFPVVGRTGPGAALAAGCVFSVRKR